MQSCEISCIKYLIFGFNFIFAVSGIGLITVGALALCSTSDFESFDEGEIMVPSILLVVTGVIIFIVAFVGCFGAYLESYCMLITATTRQACSGAGRCCSSALSQLSMLLKHNLSFNKENDNEGATETDKLETEKLERETEAEVFSLLFAVFLLIIFIVELAAGIAAAVVNGELPSDKFQESLQKYSTEEKHKTTWDSVQSKMMCCGVKGPSDWGNSLPVSCCREFAENVESQSAYCTTNASNKKYLSTVGCLDKMEMGIKSNSNALIGVGIGFAFIEVLGVVLACWLAAVIKKESKAGSN